MKKLFSKRLMRDVKKSWKKNKRYLLPATVAMGLLLGLMAKNSIADDGSAGRGFFGGALTGAAIGGIAGGGRGAGIGALAGGLLGAGIGASRGSRSSDPYRKLDKEERKLYKLQDRYDRTSSDRKRQSLQRKIDRQQARVDDLKARLGVQTRTAPQMQYQPRYQQRPSMNYEQPKYQQKYPQYGYAQKV